MEKENRKVDCKQKKRGYLMLLRQPLFFGIQLLFNNVYYANKKDALSVLH
jgi:hypothetical protein